MLREGEEGWTVFANCDGRGGSKQITYVKEMHSHAPGHSEGVTTVQVNAKLQGEPPFFAAIEVLSALNTGYVPF